MWQLDRFHECIVCLCLVLTKQSATEGCDNPAMHHHVRSKASFVDKTIRYRRMWQLCFPLSIERLVRARWQNNPLQKDVTTVETICANIEALYSWQNNPLQKDVTTENEKVYSTTRLIPVDKTIRYRRMWQQKERKKDLDI